MCGFVSGSSTFAAYANILTQSHRPRFPWAAGSLFITHFVLGVGPTRGRTQLRSCRPRPKGPLLLRTLWGCVHSHRLIDGQWTVHRTGVVYRHVLLVRRLCLVALAPAVGLCPRLGLTKKWWKPRVETEITQGMQKGNATLYLASPRKVFGHQGVKLNLYEAIGGSPTSTGSVGNKKKVGKTYP